VPHNRVGACRYGEDCTTAACSLAALGIPATGISQPNGYLAEVLGLF